MLSIIHNVQNLPFLHIVLLDAVSTIKQKYLKQYFFSCIFLPIPQKDEDDNLVLFISYTDVIQKTGISLEARRYIKDNNLFHTGFGPAQCLENFPKTRRGIEKPPIQNRFPPVVTVTTGMNSFPAEFLRQFLLSNPIR